MFLVRLFLASGRGSPVVGPAGEYTRVRSFGHPNNGQVVLYKGPGDNPQEVVITIWGLNGATKDVIDSCAEVGLKGVDSLIHTPRGQAAMEAVRTAQTQFSRSRLTVVGHSMGGAVTLCLGRVLQIEGHAFNPPAGPVPIGVPSVTVYCTAFDCVSWKWPFYGLCNFHYSKESSGGVGHNLAHCFRGRLD